jgi:hypothetical protein
VVGCVVVVGYLLGGDEGRGARAGETMWSCLWGWGWGLEKPCLSLVSRTCFVTFPVAMAACKLSPDAEGLIRALICGAV